MDNRLGRCDRTCPHLAATCLLRRPAQRVVGLLTGGFAERSPVHLRLVHGSTTEGAGVDLLEHQGKQLFARFGIPVSDGVVASTPAEAGMPKRANSCLP